MTTMPLSVRERMCPDCGANHNRGVNAAINLHTVADHSSPDGESSIDGCLSPAPHRTRAR
jgi:transposase